MKKSIFKRQLGLYCLCAIVFYGCEQKAENKETVKIDAAEISKETVIQVDSSKLSIKKLHPKALPNPAKAVTVDKVENAVVLYTGLNCTGDSLSFPVTSATVQTVYSGSSLGKFAQTPVKSVRVPFGYCTDILFNTNLFERQPTVSALNVQLPGFVRMAQFKLVNIAMNQYFAPGRYLYVNANVTSPKMITVYPWTDFYFSTDDNAVPSAISEVGVYYSNGDGNSSEGAIVQFNTKSKIYTKTLKYQIPAGKKVNVWEATKNGDASGWDYTVDPSTNLLTVHLHLEKGSIAGPTNWVGVRASIIN